MTSLAAPDAIAREIDLGDSGHARRAVEILVEQMKAEGTPITEASVLEQARERYFLTLDAHWQALLDHGDEDELKDLLRIELDVRIAKDDIPLRLTLRRICREQAGRLKQMLRSTLDRHGPERAKRAVCVFVWQQIVGDHLDHAGGGPVRSLSPGEPLSDAEERRVAADLQVMAFIELVDLRETQRTEIVRAATPAIPGRQGGQYVEEIGEDYRPRRGGGALKFEPVRSRMKRELTEEDLSRLGEAAERLAQAVPAARQTMVDAQSEWAPIVNQMAQGNYEDIPEVKRTRALHRLGRMLNETGFACGARVTDPEAFLGARHVFPSGFRVDLSDRRTREGKALHGEVMGTKAKDGRRKALTLKELAVTAGYTWPAGNAPDDAWADVVLMLAGLRVSRRRARDKAPALHEHDPFSRLPTGLPSRFAKPRSEKRRAKLEDEEDRLFEYGRVIVLPESALAIEALARRRKDHEQVLPPPLNKKHVGEWFYFPRGGIDG